MGYFGNFGINVLDPLAKVFTPTRKIHHLISNSKEDRGKLYQKSGLNYPDKACCPDIFSSFSSVLNPLAKPYQKLQVSGLNLLEKNFGPAKNSILECDVNTLMELSHLSITSSISLVSDNFVSCSSSSLDPSTSLDTYENDPFMQPCSRETENEFLSTIPDICEIETPDLTFADSSTNDLNPFADLCVPILTDLDTMDTSSNHPCGNISNMTNDDDPLSILKELKERNLERPVIGHLNINSLSSKFEPLTFMIKDNLDFLVISESKLDDTFPHGQFRIEGYARPIRLDRCRNGGGVIIFFREDLICNEIRPRLLYPDLECTFLEMRIRQGKWLVVVGYNPHKDRIKTFLDKISEEVDKLVPKYENLLMLGDWNSTVNEGDMAEFCETYNLENLINEPTCFKCDENRP